MDSLDRRRPKPAPERSDKPLWFMAAGLAIAVASRSMKDEAVGDVVLLFGLIFALVALFYWWFRPRHGL